MLLVQKTLVPPTVGSCLLLWQHRGNLPSHAPSVETFYICQRRRLYSTSVTNQSSHTVSTCNMDASKLALHGGSWWVQQLSHYPWTLEIEDCIANAITTPLQVLSYFIDIIVDLQSLKGMQSSGHRTDSLIQFSRCSRFLHLAFFELRQQIRTAIVIAMHRALRHTLYVNAGAYTLLASLTNHRTPYQHVSWMLVN